MKKDQTIYSINVKYAKIITLIILNIIGASLVILICALIVSRNIEILNKVKKLKTSFNREKYFNSPVDNKDIMNLLE